MKKVALISMSVIGIFSLLNDATALQLLPVGMYVFMAYLNIWKNLKNDVGIISLTVIMLLINITSSFFIDVLMWGIVFAAHFKSVK